MSDGHTMIGNALGGHGLQQGKAGAGGSGGDRDDKEYLAAAAAATAEEDEAVLEREEEEHLVHEEELTSEEDEKVERRMLTAALVNSVVETSKTKDSQGSTEGNGDPKQRYSLRKRRRLNEEAPEESGATQSPPKTRATATIAPNPPAAAKPPESTPVTGAAMTQSEKAKTAQLQKLPSPRNRAATVQKPTISIRTEQVPAITLKTPLQCSNLPTPSSLPPALQPRIHPQAPLSPKPSTQPATAATPILSNRATARSQPTKGNKPGRVQAAPAPAAVCTTSQPLIPNPNPHPTGVPNPLSNPLPASKPTLVSKQKGPSALKSTAKISVPCPLPSVTFHQRTASTQLMPPPPCVPTHAPAPEPVVETKRVTIAPEPVQSRGRIFSIDLDPASLDFSVLDNGEGGTPAPASADLPLVTGNARDRAFSFECFAFGINADEPLPPPAPGSDGATWGRQRGDSIIFDPSSFQEGGIHEEHALTTRETRGMSIELDAVMMGSSSSSYHNEQSGNHTYYAPSPSPMDCSSSTSIPAPALSHHYPDADQSNPHVVSVPSHPGQPHSHRHHVGAGNGRLQHPSNPTHDMPGSSLSTVMGSCSASTTLQMELLNKDGRIGIYLPEARRERIARFHAKRKMRIWRKRIKYDCRKKLADSRPRIKGRFVKRADMD